jgi:hypothetical protein
MKKIFVCPTYRQDFAFKMSSFLCTQMDWLLAHFLFQVPHRNAPSPYCISVLDTTPQWSRCWLHCNPLLFLDASTWYAMYICLPSVLGVRPWHIAPGHWFLRRVHERWCKVARHLYWRLIHERWWSIA